MTLSMSPKLSPCFLELSASRACVQVKEVAGEGGSPDLSPIPDLAFSYSRSALRFYTFMPPCKV